VKKALANSDRLIVDHGNVAHRPDNRRACGQPGVTVTVVQAMVWLKPTKCSRCFAQNDGSLPW
jgi:hypothetical protein